MVRDTLSTVEQLIEGTSDLVLDIRAMGQSYCDDHITLAMNLAVQVTATLSTIKDELSKYEKTASHGVGTD